MTPSPARVRAAFTLVELLVAMPIAMLVATAAAVLLIRTARSTRAQSAALGSSRELRHARQVLAADLEPLDGGHLRFVSDTLLEFEGQLGVLIACAGPAMQALVVRVPPGSGDHWVSALRAGDQLTGWREDTDPSAQPMPVAAALAAPPLRSGVGVCGPDRDAAPLWRVPLADTRAWLSAGPVSVHRPVRYRHYRSGTAWWLGRHTFDGHAWDGVQPVAGPLLAPTGAGLRMSVMDEDGHPVTVDRVTADSVRRRAALVVVTLRTARRVREPWSPATDSATLMAPLRASAFRRRP